MKYRKKPVVIEAVQWNGSGSLNNIPQWYKDAGIKIIGVHLYIETLKGTMTANIGDWIIRGVKGEIYPCKPDIFAATYEKVNQ